MHTMSLLGCHFEINKEKILFESDLPPGVQLLRGISWPERKIPHTNVSSSSCFWICVYINTHWRLSNGAMEQMHPHYFVEESKVIVLLPLFLSLLKIYLSWSPYNQVIILVINTVNPSLSIQCNMAILQGCQLSRTDCETIAIYSFNTLSLPVFILLYS